MSSKKATVQSLIDLGVPKAMASQVYYRMGAGAEIVISENPYRLLDLDEGSAWRIAELVAHASGFHEDDVRRVQGAILQVFFQAGNDGHVFLPLPQFQERITRLIGGIEADTVFEALENCIQEEQIIAEPDCWADDARIYAWNLHHAESETAERLMQLYHAPSSMGLAPASDDELEVVEEKLGISLADSQRDTLYAAMEQKVIIVTGGPGTGKTTVLKGVLNLFLERHAKVLLAAPTGRAARRLADTTSRKASTLHRLLEYNMDTQRFNRDASNPLKCDVLIIDEASMIDISLMQHVIRALKPSTHLVLVGDVDQLPSVGPGAVLTDLIESECFQTIRLTEIFRQRAGSLISLNAQKINRGEMPDMEGLGLDSGQDFFFINRPEVEQAQRLILELVGERIPRQFGFDPLSQIQVLTPMNKKPLGVHVLNEQLQECINPASHRMKTSTYGIAMGDKVMQIRNDYSKEVFNGDVGFVTQIKAKKKQVVLTFDGRDVVYEWGDLEFTSLAYAVTVHKSQGSEYPAVVMPIHRQHYPLLQRNLLYTAVSRGKGLVVLVGDPRALEIAVQNNKIQHRNTGLKSRLRDLS